MFEYLKYVHRANESAVIFDPKDMVLELIAYGEPEAAEALPKIGLKTLAKIAIRAYSLDAKSIGLVGPVMVDTMICLAIVEHVEGKLRPLKRKRRVYPKVVRKGRRK